MRFAAVEPVDDVQETAVGILDRFLAVDSLPIDLPVLPQGIEGADDMLFVGCLQERAESLLQVD